MALPQELDDEETVDTLGSVSCSVVTAVVEMVTAVCHGATSAGNVDTLGSVSCSVVTTVVKMVTAVSHSAILPV